MVDRNDGSTMVMSAINANGARGVADLIGAAHMSQSVVTGVNLANHISEESENCSKF
jgi:hypothetical protein